MFTEDEKRFFDALEAALVAARKSPAVNITRMADKALSVRSRHGYLGKIKLQGRKTWMQYMTSLYNAEVAENRPLEEYIQLLTALVLRAVTTGREQLIFSQKDRSRIGKAVVVAANEALVKEVAPELPDSLTDSKVGAFLGKMVNSATAQITGTGLLTLSEETRPIRGGFILVDGPVEVNCSFEAMLRLQREKLEKPAAEILFGS